jgi:hypothetical protein
MSQITLRKLDSTLESLNEVCTELIEQALEFEKGSDKKRDLSDLAGSWTDADYLDFEKNRKSFERIDEELWKKPTGSSSPPL